jgi:chorismate dehydratase
VPPLRIGVVAYLNSRPLARGLERWKGDGRFELHYLPPATLADELAAGRLDVGLLPSVELLRIPDLAVVPGLAIAATREVRSVLLISKVPIHEIRRVALDENSRTSAALVRIVLAERYGIQPESAPAAPELESMLAGADAALVIGDPALRVDRSRYVVLDLAAEWFELTGLPFVFAVWAARRERATPALVAMLAESLEIGLAELEAIVGEASRESGLKESVLGEYYRAALRFRLGPHELTGLQTFLARADTGRREPLELALAGEPA